MRGRSASPKIGIFQRGSHRIVDIPSCIVQHPQINRVAAVVKQGLRQLEIAPYAERAHVGQLRALQVVIERSSSSAQVVLVCNGSTPDSVAPLLDFVSRELGAGLHSLWWNGNPERTNTLLGELWARHSGPEAIRETIGGADVFFPPAAFGQANLPLADALVARVHEWVRGAEVAEFYSGSGAIGLGLVGSGRHVTFNERAEGGLRGLELGIAALPEVARAGVRCVPGGAGEIIDEVGALAAFDTMIVDPPRRGLDAALTAALVASPPARLIYVSCSLDSLERDISTLEPGLRLSELVAFALFPFTDHVETLARFERVEERSR